MALTIDTIGEVTVVTVNLDQFDASNADEFKREIGPVLKATRKLVLDLSPVQFADSRACGAILSCLQHLAEGKGDLKICSVNKPVRMIFELIRLHRICDILNTRDEAVRAFATA